MTPCGFFSCSCRSDLEKTDRIRDFYAVAGPWSHCSHGNMQTCNTIMDVYVPFRKDRSATWGGRLAHYVRQQLECVEFCLGMSDEPMESLSVRIKEQASTGEVIVGIYYRPPEQEEQADEAV